MLLLCIKLATDNSPLRSPPAPSPYVASGGCLEQYREVWGECAIELRDGGGETPILILPK
jgi:hypothetical protein